MTDRENEMADAADKYAMEFLSLEETAGMIKGKWLRGSQEDRMRRFVRRKMRAHESPTGQKFGSIKLTIFLIMNLAKIIYAAWKLWQERHNQEAIGHA